MDKQLHDSIFNWLQITVVYEARPEDVPAKETSEFFRGILANDLNIEEIRYERDPFKYTVFYKVAGKEEEKVDFDLALIDKLIDDIEKEPKFRV